MKLIFDMEADNLIPGVTRCWCVVTKDVETGEIRQYPPDNITQALEDMSGADMLIGHNIIGYDFPVLDMLYNWSPTSKVLDTYVLSRLLNPDRKGHSIEWWGTVFKREKPTHEDWSRYSEEMLHRCTEDVEINYVVYKYLMKEMRDGTKNN